MTDEEQILSMLRRTHTRLDSLYSRLVRVETKLTAALASRGLIDPVTESHDELSEPKEVE